MKRVLYAGGAFLTDDAVATALTSYAAALARVDSADTVIVPGLNEQGVSHDVEVLLGPASQMLIEDADVVGVIESAAFVGDLKLRGDKLHSPALDGAGGVGATFYDPL